jgi:hypothetical protein
MFGVGTIDWPNVLMAWLRSSEAMKSTFREAAGGAPMARWANEVKRNSRRVFREITGILAS